MVLILHNEKTPVNPTPHIAILRRKGINIVRTFKGDYLIYKRSVMEKSTWEIIATAGATIVTALAGVFGFQRFQAKKVAQLDRDKIAVTEIQYIIDTLKSYKDDAEKRLIEKDVIIIEKDKKIDELIRQVAQLETELKFKK